jgi:hypothetical protein
MQADPANPMATAALDQGKFAQLEQLLSKADMYTQFLTEQIHDIDTKINDQSTPAKGAAAAKQQAAAAAAKGKGKAKGRQAKRQKVEKEAPVDMKTATQVGLRAAGLPQALCQQGLWWLVVNSSVDPQCICQLSSDAAALLGRHPCLMASAGTTLARLAVLVGKHPAVPMHHMAFSPHPHLLQPHTPAGAVPDADVRAARLPAQGRQVDDQHVAERPQRHPG